MLTIRVFDGRTIRVDRASERSVGGAGGELSYQLVVQGTPDIGEHSLPFTLFSPSANTSDLVWRLAHSTEGGGKLRPHELLRLRPPHISPSQP
jgi:hypothetical protein